MHHVIKLDSIMLNNGWKIVAIKYSPKSQKTHDEIVQVCLTLKSLFKYEEISELEEHQEQAEIFL